MIRMKVDVGGRGRDRLGKEFGPLLPALHRHVGLAQLREPGTDSACSDGNLVPRVSFGGGGLGTRLALTGFAVCRSQYKLLKGCLDCANRTVGCENLKKRMSSDFKLNITQCYVDCCDDNECNTKEPNPPTPPPPRASSPQLSSLSLALPVSLVVQAYFIL